jgi:xanthine dehydrogenase accessory factor
VRDLLPHLRQWYADGAPFAVATVIDTFRSAHGEPAGWAAGVA